MLEIDFSTVTKSNCLSKRSGPHSVHDNNSSCFGSFFHLDKNDYYCCIFVIDIQQYKAN